MSLIMVYGHHQCRSVSCRLLISHHIFSRVLFVSMNEKAELKAAQLEAKQQRERALKAESALAEELGRRSQTGEIDNPSPSSCAEGRDKRLLWHEVQKIGIMWLTLEAIYYPRG